MPAMELLCRDIGVNPHHLSKEENLILEAELFYGLCDQLKKIFKAECEDYFRLINFNLEKEDNMIDANFIRCIIKDILSTETYTLPGIATYTQMPEEVIYDVAGGYNINPSLSLSRKIIELHRSVRRDFYRQLLIKVTHEN